MRSRNVPIVILGAILVVFIFALKKVEKKVIEPMDVVNTLGEKTSFEVVEFDGCEYLYMESYRKIVLTHKGNCKNH